MPDVRNFRIWSLLLEKGLGEVAPTIASEAGKEGTPLAEVIYDAHSNGNFQDEWNAFLRQAPAEADEDLTKVAWLAVRVTGTIPTLSHVKWLYEKTYAGRKFV